MLVDKIVYLINCIHYYWKQAVTESFNIVIIFILLIFIAYALFMYYVIMLVVCSNLWYINNYGKQMYP